MSERVEPTGRLRWRDRLALWCLRQLTPDGICADNLPVEVTFGSGKSTPQRPALVMYVRLYATKQTIIALVWDSDTAVQEWANAVDGLRRWAKANR